MPTFMLTAPDGKKYKVTGDTAEGAYDALQQKLGGAPPPAQTDAQKANAAAQPSGGPDMQDYYSSGMYSGKYNPLGKIASVLDPTYSSAKSPDAAAPTAVDNYYNSGIYSGDMNPLGTVARSLDAGATGAQDMSTLGWSDELQGALPGGNVDDARARRQELYGSNPVASTVGQIAGGASAMKGLSAVGNLLTKIPGVAGAVSLGSSYLPAATSIVGAGLRGGVGGATLGGLYGYGSGEGDNRLQNAATNAMIGGALGVGIPVVATGVGAGIRNAANRVAQQQVATDVGVMPSVASHLAQRIEADNAFGAVGQGNMARSGSEAMLVDAGPSLQGSLDAAIAQGGPAAGEALRRVGDRVGRSSQAVTDALDTHLGIPEGAGTAQRNIGNASRAAVNDVYEGPTGAYAQPINYASPEGMRVESIINRIPPRIANKAIQSANERMIYDQMPNQQIKANIADDGSMTFQEMPNVRQADAIKRALNDIVKEGTDDITGKMSPDAQFASKMATDLRNAVRDAVPEYRTALETAADPLSRQSAVDFGSKLLTMNKDRSNTMAAQFTTAPEKDAIAQGIRSQFDEVIGNVKRTVQNGDMAGPEAYKAIRELSSRNNREKMTAAIGADRVDPLLKVLDEAAETFRLQGNLAQNSKTAGRQATIQGVKDLNAPGPIDTLLAGEPLNAGKKVASILSNQTPEARQALDNEAFRQIADVLTRPSVQAQNDFLAMTNYRNATLANQARGDLVARILAGGRTPAYPFVARSGEKKR